MAPLSQLLWMFLATQRLCKCEKCNLKVQSNYFWANTHERQVGFNELWGWAQLLHVAHTEPLLISWALRGDGPDPRVAELPSCSYPVHPMAAAMTWLTQAVTLMSTYRCVPIASAPWWGNISTVLSLTPPFVSNCSHTWGIKDMFLPWASPRGCNPEC